MTDTLIHGLYREGGKIADTKAPHDVPISERWARRQTFELIWDEKALFSGCFFCLWSR